MGGFMLRKGQIVKNWIGEELTVKHMGLCVVCHIQCVGFVGDTAPDWRGPAGEQAYAPLIAEEYGMIGSDIPVCAQCASEGDRYRLAVVKAKRQWRAK